MSNAHDSLDAASVRLMDEIAPVQELLVRSGSTSCGRAIRTRAQYDRAVAIYIGLSNGLDGSFDEDPWAKLMARIGELIHDYEKARPIAKRGLVRQTGASES
jgi:hypothetical protein